MNTVFDVASDVSTPLALAGLLAAVVFFVFRQIVAKNIFPQLTAAIGARLLRQIVDRLFILALAAMVLGFVGYLVTRIWPERDGQPTVDVGAVSRVVRAQLESRDYATAWNSLTVALRDDPGSEELLDVQAKVAMHWIRDLTLPEPQRFTDVVDKLLPALYQAAERWKQSKRVAAAADSLAHVGWANFLKRRDGGQRLEVAERYREALQLDADNPFAHAMWGHWLIVDGNDLAKAKAQFAAALKSNREQAFVRRWQLAALRWVSSDENAIELISVCNDMRKSGESLDQDTRSRLQSDIYFGHRKAVLANLGQILTPAEHLATYRWLVDGFDLNQSGYKTFFLARLSEATGDCSDAQRLYVSLISADTLSHELSREVQEGLDRCKSVSPNVG